MGEQLSQSLEPIAAWFRSLNTPEPIVHWGHPVMMGIVVFVMGGFVLYTGWRGRLTPTGEEESLKNRTEHRQIAPLMFLFISMGYTGGVLSLVIQNKPTLESPHFWTGSLVIILLGINALIALSGFGGQQKGALRTVHAYLGSFTFVVLVVHAIFGIKLGLSI